MKKPIDKMTIIRTLVLILGLVNLALQQTGHDPLPFTDENISMVVSYAWAAGASLWAWWKNNSFTQAAITADETMKELKTK